MLLSDNETQTRSFKKKNKRMKEKLLLPVTKEKLRSDLLSVTSVHKQKLVKQLINIYFGLTLNQSNWNIKNLKDFIVSLNQLTTCTKIQIIYIFIFIYKQEQMS